MYISDEACKVAVLAFVIGHLDCCNGLLAGARERLFDKLQRIQNRAARLVARPRVTRGQILHITPVLQQLHWLPVRHHVTYKLCLRVFRYLHGTAPPYLTKLLHPYIRDQRLRRASYLQSTRCWSKRAMWLALLLGTLYCPVCEQLTHCCVSRSSWKPACTTRIFVE